MHYALCIEKNPLNQCNPLLKIAVLLFRSFLLFFQDTVGIVESEFSGFTEVFVGLFSLARVEVAEAAVVVGFG